MPLRYIVMRAQIIGFVPQMLVFGCKALPSTQPLQASPWSYALCESVWYNK